MAQLNDWPWRHWATQRPEATAVIFGRQQVSWWVLQRQVEALAAEFQHQGVLPGHGVALCGKNSYFLLLAYLALLQCGARLLPLNPKLPEALLATLLPDLDIAFAFSPDDMPTLPSSVIVLSSSGQCESKLHWQPWDVNRLATLTLTSGSSGVPKAAAHSYAAHLGSAEAVLHLMDFQPHDSWLLSLPLFHVSGQGIVWRWLTVGATLVVRDMQPLADALAGCTHASLVPTQLWRLLSEPMIEHALKEVLLGGAMIPVSLTQQAESMGVRCWCGYGLTELASTVCVKRADELPGVGLPLPGREIRLVEQEVWIRSNSLALGYWHQGQLRPLADAEGWFHTRDRGAMEHGELRIIGRMDNLFFCGGEGVQPEDVERILTAHPQVTQIFIVPVEDPEFGQRAVAVIESEGELTLAALLAWAEDRLVSFQRPIALLPLPAELKSGGIKISRRRLQQWASKQLAESPDY
ncbi:o-succinylbenzoate--CoA ligase [Serratia sp. UGAL515B_01]|uniref:o-succinylbenzoate--CoA ligase n=1 Tax=Serratia sp. UGAL515B_01 TaxID=2986763 RepID=UPI0029556DE0|nr:o-succinylbenzoate--CoA ligase [Serratia sp. UGAL515B_01]WON75635.1 o-succinylbenzoate--CoA ligase [Serratia sp. UGAL515B_01]